MDDTQNVQNPQDENKKVVAETAEEVVASEAAPVEAAEEAAPEAEAPQA